MFALIDNYDSFTYNLWHYLGEMGAKVDVFRNDSITADQLFALNPEGIIVSPGPSDPDHAGICLEVIGKAAIQKTPLFGVCLGHQSIGQAFGGAVVRAPSPVHGKTDQVWHNGAGVFSGVPSPFTATRYHSLIVEKDNLPDCLEVTAWNKDGLIMGLAHKNLPIFGVQFHPESIASDYGHKMLGNFLSLAGGKTQTGESR